MIEPTIGRVVLFNDGQSDQRVPAIICYVWSNEMINIAGFDCNGNTFNRTSVTLIQEGDCPVGSAEWMPYQKGQAAKTEALEQEIADAGPETEGETTG